jgi:cell division protein FtsZ
VVATGLAPEQTAEGEGEGEEAAEAEAPARPVFGYTGKQPVPVRRPVQPGPIVARNKPQPQPVIAEEEEEDEEETVESREAAPSAPVRPQPVRSPQPPRMPTVEEFPPIAQRQIAAQQNRIENIAEHANRKKRGLFERLAGVGLSRKGDLPAQKEPELSARAEPKTPPADAQQSARAAAIADASFDDDQLEIPAFLRRQAN